MYIGPQNTQHILGPFYRRAGNGGTWLWLVRQTPPSQAGMLIATEERQVLLRGHSTLPGPMTSGVRKERDPAGLLRPSGPPQPRPASVEPPHHRLSALSGTPHDLPSGPQLR